MPRSKPFPTKRADRPKRQREAEGERPVPQSGMITAIQSQVNDPDRVSVFIEGSFAIGVARDVADACGLYQGQVLDDAGIADLLAREQLNKATSAALNFLAYRPRSEGEIRRRLQRGGYPVATVDAVIDKLRSWRYVDDEDFARRWIENRAAHRPRGARLLVQELQAKGIDRRVMAEALDEAELDEASDALTLARQRARQLRDLEPEVRERRLTGFLARRGYGFDVIRATLEALREEPGDEPSSDPD